MRVLAVDDEVSILELLSEALPVLGCESVKTAQSADDALQILRDEQPEIDCFLLDIQMPFKDGTVLCAEIREIEQYRTTPVIMLTAMSEKAYVDAAFQSGATDYLTKPFDMTELSNRLKLAAHRHKMDKNNDNLGNAISSASSVDPESLDDVERVISLTAFENYVLQLTRARLVTSGLFAIKVPQLEKPAKGTSDSDERQLRVLFAKTISQATQYDQSVISYAGKGVFLVLNKTWGTNKKETLHASIYSIFGELDKGTSLTAGSIPEFVVGSVVSLPAFGRSFTLSYLHKAIQRAESLCEVAPAKKSKWRQKFSRIREKESQTHEYQKLLTELIGELGPLEDNAPKQKVAPRRVVSLSTPPQLRTAV